MLLKIAPDLSYEQIDDVIDLALEIKLDGIVATNTTISREGLVHSSRDWQPGSGWSERGAIKTKKYGDNEIHSSKSKWTNTDNRQRRDLLLPSMQRKIKCRGIIGTGLDRLYLRGSRYSQTDLRAPMKIILII